MRRNAHLLRFARMFDRLNNISVLSHAAVVVVVCTHKPAACTLAHPITNFKSLYYYY